MSCDQGSQVLLHLDIIVSKDHSVKFPSTSQSVREPDGPDWETLQQPCNGGTLSKELRKLLFQPDMSVCTQEFTYSQHFDLLYFPLASQELK